MGKNPLVDCVGFEWDEWNSGKIWERHRVTPEDAEEIFFGDPFVLKSDAAHSASKARYGVLGQTAKGRRLFVAFTVRGKLIRVISARDMNQREDRSTGDMKKAIPEFKSEAEEFEFWSTADSIEYFDWSAAQKTKFVNLKPTLRTISVRLPVAMVEDLKLLANQRDVPYQSLLKIFLAERLQQERNLRRAV